ncbi:MAG: hypothetical protein EHM19_08050, partial [Candidatus Latescibacterota bacterium]
PEGYVEISPEEAERLRVRDKHLVRVSSAAGAMEIAVKVTDAVQTGTACVPYFIKNMTSDFLMRHEDAFTSGEDGLIPIRIEKV